MNSHVKTRFGAVSAASPDFFVRSCCRCVSTLAVNHSKMRCSFFVVSVRAQAHLLARWHNAEKVCSVSELMPPMHSLSTRYRHFWRVTHSHTDTHAHAHTHTHTRRHMHTHTRTYVLQTYSTSLLYYMNNSLDIHINTIVCAWCSPVGSHPMHSYALPSYSTPNNDNICISIITITNACEGVKLHSSINVTYLSTYTENNKA